MASPFAFIQNAKSAGKSHSAFTDRRRIFYGYLQRIGTRKRLFSIFLIAKDFRNARTQGQLGPKLHQNRELKHSKRWGCGSTRTVDSRRQLSPVLEPNTNAQRMSLLIYCAQLGPPRATIVGASRAVSDWESRHPHSSPLMTERNNFWKTWKYVDARIMVLLTGFWTSWN